VVQSGVVKYDGINCNGQSVVFSSNRTYNIS
jgi:hypothetical protein